MIRQAGACEIASPGTPLAMIRLHPARTVNANWIVRLACATCCAWVGAAAALAETVLPALARPVDQARFRVTAFAAGLGYPTSMATLADGSLLVATSDGGTDWQDATSQPLLTQIYTGVHYSNSSHRSRTTMTSITLPDAILSQIKPGERAIEVCDTSGRRLGYFAPLATADDYLNARSAVSEDELDRRSLAGGGRPLADILRDLESGKRP